MSNRACIQRCEFVDFPARDVSYGFRAYDDYGQTYLNTATAEVLALDHLAFLAWVAKNVDDEYVVGMLDSVKESERGLYIDDIWWEWEDVRPILSDGSRIECDYGESEESTVCLAPHDRRSDDQCQFLNSPERTGRPDCGTQCNLPGDV